MSVIHAWQHIYTNVEKEQSPTGQGGFQTLFYSRDGLTEAEVVEIEGRLLYFPSSTEPVKRLFFTTRSGKGVVAQIVALPDPDRLGRGGRYLAHSLIFSPQALALFEADPFRVFRRFPFATGVAEGLSLGDFQTGDISPVSLNLPPEPEREIEAVRGWPAPELKKLALLALQAGQQAQQRQVVTLVGQPEQLESILEAALALTPAALRPRCTFDTYFYRCNLVASYFWAIGLPEAPPVSNYALIGSKTRQVQGPVTSQPETAYERWLLAALEAQPVDTVVNSREQAFAVAELLEDRWYEAALLETASPELAAEVLQVNPRPVQARLRRSVSQHLPPVLVDRVTGIICHQADQAVLYRYLRQGIELADLLELLYRSYATDSFKSPPATEIEAIETFLTPAEQPGLLHLLLAYWRDPARQLPPALALAGEETYRRVVEIALERKLVYPLDLLVAGRGNTFLDLYHDREVDKLVKLVGRLLEIKEEGCLLLLEADVSRLPDQEIRRLGKLIARYPETPEAFRKAIEQRLAGLPQRRGIKEWLRIFGRWLPGGRL